MEVREEEKVNFQDFGRILVIAFYWGSHLVCLGQNANIKISFRIVRKEIKDAVVLFLWSKPIRKELFNVLTTII